VYDWLLFKDIAASLRHKSPDQDGDPSNRDDDRFGQEQPTELVGVNVQERQLEDPKDQEASHAVGGNPLVGWDVVLHAQITRPDRTDHDSHGIAAVDGLDRKPEYGQDDSREDRDVGTPEPPAGSGEDGEWRVVYGTDGAIGGDHDGDDEESDRDDDQRFAISQTDRNDTAGEFPSRGIERVRYPVRWSKQIPLTIRRTNIGRHDIPTKLVTPHFLR
jgi:hypothetical protein